MSVACICEIKAIKKIVFVTHPSRDWAMWHKVESTTGQQVKKREFIHHHTGKRRRKKKAIQTKKVSIGVNPGQNSKQKKLLWDGANGMVDTLQSLLNEHSSSTTDTRIHLQLEWVWEVRGHQNRDDAEKSFTGLKTVLAAADQTYNFLTLVKLVRGPTKPEKLKTVVISSHPHISSFSLFHRL